MARHGQGDAEGAEGRRHGPAARVALAPHAHQARQPAPLGRPPARRPGAPGLGRRPPACPAPPVLAPPGLPPPLASRFDIIWMLRDEVKGQDDERIARYILDNRTKGVSETKIEEAISLDPAEETKDDIYSFTVDDTEHLSLEFLRKYIAYAKRNHDPDLNADARAKILDYYTNERQSFGREDQMGAEVIPITARALEALIRLTEAHARMHLRDTATGDDAKVALAVFRHWREESNIEDDSELYSGVSATARSNNTTIRNIVRDICSTGDGTASITEIYNAASARKIPDTMVDDVIQRMLTSGELFNPSGDRYGFAR